MKIAICDDDSLELEKVKNTVNEFIVQKQPNPQITVSTFTSGNDLLRDSNKYGGFDLLILDIIMPGMNGLKLAAEIRENDSCCKIIFLTSSPEFAVNSYKVNAFYYLLKPFPSDELEVLLDKAFSEMEEETSSSIIIKEKGKLTRVQIHTIQYVESYKHTIHLHLRGNEAISCYSTLNEFNAVLLSDKRFIKCHKSFIVNLNYIISISDKDFIMSNNSLVPISRQVYQQVKNVYIDYFFKKELH